jgi:8-oxo-dGTP pyrophosphatase MutT (NUDIX family)
MSGVVDSRGRIRAAGGVVLRDGAVLVVHRPRYDDWSFPKGKADHPGEPDEDTALREVLEETGLRCALGKPLPALTYTDHHGRSKIVRYWCMRVEGGDFEPADEVDEIRWLPPEEARRLLTYDHDRALVDALEECADA